MFIAETRIFAVGRFTVQQRPRLDSPAWAVFIVFLGERLIGKNFSLPSVSDCEWLLRTRDQYATPDQNTRKQTYRDRQYKQYMRRGVSRRGRPRKADAERELAEALDT